MLLIISKVLVVFVYIGIRLPDYAMEIFTTVGDVTIPLSMITLPVWIVILTHIFM